MPVQRLSPWCCEPETFFIRASSLRAQKDGVGSIFKDLMMYMGTHVASQFIVRVGFGLETTVALLGCEPRCARFLFLALSSRSACARGLGPRDDGRLAGVRTEVRAVPLLGLVLALHVRVGLGLETTVALLGCEPRCVGLETAFALLGRDYSSSTSFFLALPSLCFCLYWLSLCTCTCAWA